MGKKASQLQVHAAQELKASAPMPPSLKLADLPSVNNFNPLKLKTVTYKVVTAMLPTLEGHCKDLMK